MSELKIISEGITTNFIQPTVELTTQDVYNQYKDEALELLKDLSYGNKVSIHNLPGALMTLCWKYYHRDHPGQ